MKIVIDANRIIAALIRDSTTRNILFDDEFEFLTPDYATVEINRHRKELQRKIGLNDTDFDLLVTIHLRKHNNPSQRILC